MTTSITNFPNDAKAPTALKSRDVGTGPHISPTDNNVGYAATRQKNNISISVHCLTCTLFRKRRSTKEEVQFIQKCLGRFNANARFSWEEIQPRQFYKKSILGPDKVCISIGSAGAARGGRDHLQLHMPGKFLEGLELDALCWLVQELEGRFEVKATRVDLAFDHCPVSVEDVLRAIREDDLRTAVRRRRLADGSKQATYEFRQSNKQGKTDRTVYLGSPASTRQLVAYDRRGFTRFELVLRDRHAEAALNLLLLDSEQFPQAAIGLLRDFVDFVDRPSGKKGHRCQLLPWWDDIVSSTPKLRIPSISKTNTNLDQKMLWLMDSVASTFVAVANSTHDPEGFFREFYNRGLTKLTRQHWLLIKNAGRSTASLWRPREKIFSEFRTDDHEGDR